MATQAQLAAVQQLYVGYLGRAADSAGQQFWANAIANGTATIASVATGFTLSAEYKAAYGGLTTDALVEKVYNNVLGRTPDAEGKAFWVAALANGKVTADTLVATIVTNLGALDQQTINNKVFVAQTYTDTVGDAYTPAGGAAVLVGVDSTAASVATAVSAINTGTLPGQVPGLSLIAAITTAEDAVTAYGKAAAASNPTFDTGTKDGVVTSVEATAALKVATDARAGDANGGAATTNTLIASSADKAAVAATAKAAISAVTGGTAAINAYDAAFAADKAASAAFDTASESAATAASVAGLDKALTATDATVTYATLETAAGVDAGDFAWVGDVVAFLIESTNNTLLRAGLVTELSKVATYGTDIVKLGDLGLADDKADIALNAPNGAAAKLAAIDATVDTDSTTVGVQAPGYIAKATAAAEAADLLTKAQAADAKIATAKVVTDQYASLTKAVNDAKTALNTFEATNTAKVDLHDVSTVGADQFATSAKADVFYFSAKATFITGAIADFGTGDSIVLGSGFTQGTSIAAGDSNVKEFFLVQGSAGVQVVLETNAFGNSTTTTDTNGNVTASPDAAVITLTGVTIADLTVSNGIISHVA